MKKKSLFYIILCTCLFCSCEKEEIETSPIVPPVEQPDNPDEPENKPSTEDIINIKIDENIMAIVGSESWNDITYGNGKYVAVGSSYITESTNGTDWLEPKRINEYDNLEPSIICYGNEKWCIRGRTSSAISLDLKSWDIIDDKLYFTPYKSIFFKNTFFAGGANSKLIYLKDGEKNWSSFDISNSPVKDFYSMVINGDKLIVAGHKRGAVANGYMYVISNFEIKETIETNENIMYITFGNGIYVGMNNNTNIYYSTDLKNWTLSRVSDETIFLNSKPINIEYKNGVFIAFLQKSDKSYKALTSSDGKNWNIMDISIDKSKEIKRILIL